MKKIAINGFGRIGRNVARALFERQKEFNYQLVAINDLTPLESLAYLFQYDSTHGRLPFDVQFDQQGDKASLTIDGQEISVFSQRDPEMLPWEELGIDLVLESTGFFKTPAAASKHLQAGAKKVLISAPAGKDQDGTTVDATVVFGVNEALITEDMSIFSNASCTTNCLAQIAKPLHDAFGIESGMANTVHAYTASQNLLDGPDKDPRRGRAAAMSMIPTSTGAAKAIGLVIPELQGKLDASSVRVPTANVSLLDFSCLLSSDVTMEELESVLLEYKKNRENVFDVCYDPLVSIDYNHQPHSAVVDWPRTLVNGRMVKIMAWYDNEWAFSNRMLDTSALILSK